MNSECKAGPTGENSRRKFFEKIGALAAASGVAANARAPSSRLRRGRRAGKRGAGAVSIMPSRSQVPSQTADADGSVRQI